jgi:hypothetical protein
VEKTELEKSAPLYAQPVRWMAIVSIASYYRIAYRTRGWGSLPRRRGPTLLIANHQHDIESAVIVADNSFRSLSWRWPIFTVSSRRMWEQGFLAERVPWLTMLRGANLGFLFEWVGMQPIENDLAARPFVSLALALVSKHGNLSVEMVFRERVLDQLPSHVRTLQDILDPAQFTLARTFVKLTEVNEPYRAELLQLTRDELEADIAHFERLTRHGATIFLTPEGFYTIDGKMQRLRGILARLAPLAQIWVCGVSYDPYDDRRLTLLYRVRQSVPDIPLDLQLKATRPVTTCALLCTWISQHDYAAFTFDDARTGVAAELATLPRNAYVVPELRTRLDASIHSALANMQRFGTLRVDNRTYTVTDARRHPLFPRTVDMIAYQTNFHSETLEGLRECGGNDARSKAGAAG